MSIAVCPLLDGLTAAVPAQRPALALDGAPTGEVFTSELSYVATVGVQDCRLSWSDSRIQHTADSS